MHGMGLLLYSPPGDVSDSRWLLPSRLASTITSARPRHRGA